jgi:hypothetical protein
MKKAIHPLFFMLFIFVFILPSCDKVDEEDDLCKETEEAEISRSFRLGVIVKYNDGTPYEGTVALLIQKEYCNGKISGSYGPKGTTAPDGYWNPAMQYTYKFANSLDKVYVNFHLPYHSQGAEQVIEVFHYMDVAQQHFGIEKTYTLNLSFGPDE